MRQQYRGTLTPLQAASGMQAARLNALDLMDTADVLFNLKRFSHSLAFSTLAIEEAGKFTIVFALFLSLGPSPKQLWQDYRKHVAKTQFLNPSIAARVRATFRDLPGEEALRTGRAGPGSRDLEEAKQLSIYSDCFSSAKGPIWHLPRKSEWRILAYERLCECQALIPSLRDRSPRELAVWKRHVDQAHESGSNFVKVVPDIRDELVEKGIIESDWWDPLMKWVEEADPSDGHI